MTSTYDTLDLCLDASGVPPSGLEAYRRKLDGILDGFIHARRPDPDDKGAVAKAMFEYFHEDRNVKYAKHQYRLDQLIDRLEDAGAPRGNCVSLSALYGVLGERLGLPLVTVSRARHICLALRNGSRRPFLIEMTSPNGFGAMNADGRGVERPLYALAAEMYFSDLALHCARRPSHWNGLLEGAARLGRTRAGTWMERYGRLRLDSLRGWKRIPRGRERLLDKTLALLPEHEGAISSRIADLVARNRFPEAFALLESLRGPKLQPGFSAQCRAEILRGQRLYGKAQAFIEQALEADPDNPEFHLSRGRILAAQAREYEAAAEFGAALGLSKETSPLTRGALRNLRRSPLPPGLKCRILAQCHAERPSWLLVQADADILFAAHDRDAAFRLYRTLLEEKGPDAEALHDIGARYAMARQPATARPFFRAAFLRETEEYKHILRYANTFTAESRSDVAARLLAWYHEDLQAPTRGQRAYLAVLRGVDLMERTSGQRRRAPPVGEELSALLREAGAAAGPDVSGLSMPPFQKGPRLNA